MTISYLEKILLKEIICVCVLLLYIADLSRGDGWTGAEGGLHSLYFVSVIYGQIKTSNLF